MQALAVFFYFIIYPAAYSVRVWPDDEGLGRGPQKLSGESHVLTKSY